MLLDTIINCYGTEPCKDNIYIDSELPFLLEGTHLNIPSPVWWVFKRRCLLRDLGTMMRKYRELVGRGSLRKAPKRRCYGVIWVKEDTHTQQLTREIQCWGKKEGKKAIDSPREPTGRTLESHCTVSTQEIAAKRVTRLCLGVVTV